MNTQECTGAVTESARIQYRNYIYILQHKMRLTLNSLQITSNETSRFRLCDLHFLTDGGIFLKQKVNIHVEFAC